MTDKNKVNDIIEIPVTIIGAEEKSSTGQIKVEQYSDADRMLNAAKTALVGLLATLILAAIPIVHLISAAFGLIATVFLVGNSYSRKSIILEGVGHCPNCNAEFRVFKRKNTLPFYDVCESCHRQVKIIKS